ncbi:MAG: hypothetical protein HY042_08115, partial [Spirochaetia bacterium]|nr:hypothetical protein [Spirochaetia bacterium]
MNGNKLSNLIRNSSIRVRIYMILLILSMPVLALTSILTKAAIDDVALLQTETEGARFLAPYEKLMLLIPLRRGINALVIGGDLSYEARLNEVTSNIDDTL